MKKLKGAYLEMQAYPEALAAIKHLVGAGYEVWLATKPPTGIAHAYSDKAAWVFANLPELKRRIIITHDKGLLGDAGDFLVDDRPHKANCEQFKGKLIRFTNGKSWADVIKEIRKCWHLNSSGHPADQDIRFCNACGAKSEDGGTTWVQQV